MKNIVYLILALFSNCFSSQTIKPLNSRLLEVQPGDYLKDNNDELSKFTGVWVANLPDKKVELSITKLERNSTEFNNILFFRDDLLIRYRVISNSIILQETFSKNFNTNDNLKIISIGSQPLSKEVAFLVNGNDCYVGMGLLYLRHLSLTTLEWEYKPETAQVSDPNCWNNPERLKVYLPTNQKVIFTRQ